MLRYLRVSRVLGGSGCHASAERRQWSVAARKEDRTAAGSLTVAVPVAGAAHGDDREPGGEHEAGAQRTA
jgi:hypothetical protein